MLLFGTGCAAQRRAGLLHVHAIARRLTPAPAASSPPPALPQCINLTPEKGLAGLFSSFFFGFWNLMCGFLIPQSAIPGWWIW